jgi:hypothetical protein
MNGSKALIEKVAKSGQLADDGVVDPRYGRKVDPAKKGKGANELERRELGRGGAVRENRGLAYRESQFKAAVALAPRGKGRSALACMSSTTAHVYLSLERRIDRVIASCQV